MTRHIYFIKPIGMEGPIKIGCSADAAMRMDGLASWSPFPLELVVSVVGDFKDESLIHQCFHEFRSHREWFHANVRLAKLMSDLASGVPLALALDQSTRVVEKRNCGGAQWSEGMRRSMSVMHRIDAAAKRRGLNYYGQAPAHLTDLIETAKSRPLTSSEVDAVDAYANRRKAA
jgi:hypothetical protein